MNGWRLWSITLAVSFAFFGLIFNIYTIQVEKGSYYAAKVASRAQAASYLSAGRGSIYFQDKNGNKIAAAINRAFPVIFAVPKEISDPAEAAQSIAPVLGLDVAKVKTQLSKVNDEYELLLNKATGEQVSDLRALGIKGVYVDSQQFRFYPFESLASQLLGYVGPNGTNDEFSGRYGLELYYNDVLGKDDVVLTIDRNIQSQSEKVLKNLVSKFSATSGSVIVQDPKTGKILAMGNYPTFDPNDYTKFPLSHYINGSVQSLYEPGSVFKVLTMSAGIDANKITPETKFYDSGSLTLSGKTIKNWDGKAHGNITMTEVIEKSINTGAAFAERTTGHDIFYNYLLKFGVDKTSGINLPGEVPGNLNNIKTTSRDINFATAAFGQGVSLAPIQLINAVSAIANGGSLMRPYLIDGTPPQNLGEVMSLETSRAVTGMMVSAVKKAEVAQIPGYQIAGKTGTAQVPDFKNGGYSDKFIHTYVGFAPAYDPKFIVLLKLDKPDAPLAGMTVVPAFKELAQFIINYYNIPAEDPSVGGE